MINIEFQSKDPHTTSWLAIVSAPECCSRITSKEQLNAEIVMAEFKAAGWRIEREGGSLWPKWYAMRNGSDTFDGWTPAERKLYMAEARKILRRLGILKVPEHRLLLRDLL